MRVFTSKNSSPFTSFASLSPAPSLFRGFFLNSCGHSKHLLLYPVIFPWILGSVKGHTRLLDDGNSTRRNTLWILHIVVDDAVEHLLLILTGERRLVAWQTLAESACYLVHSWKFKEGMRANNLSHEHLVDEDAHPPPVHRPGVVVVREDLRSQKLRSPAEGGGAVSVTHPWIQNNSNCSSLNAIPSARRLFSDKTKLRRPSLHSPKSVIFTNPSASINRLSSFKSLSESKHCVYRSQGQVTSAPTPLTDR